MDMKKEWLAPCGLYCGVCAVMMVHRDNNQKLKERLAPLFQVSPEEIRCEGCLSDETFTYCTTCPIKSCTSQRGYEGCHECDEFPCRYIEEFPIPVGKKVILRAIPYRREVGTEKWVQDEQARYICPECGNQLFRGASKCNQCKAKLDLD
jgi:hypothetical protein